MIHIGIQENRIRQRLEFEDRLTKESTGFGLIREIIGEGSFLPDYFAAELERQRIDHRSCVLSEDRKALTV